MSRRNPTADVPDLDAEPPMTREAMEDRVASLVFVLLKVPPDYSRTKAHFLYGDKYRVNVHLARNDQHGGFDHPIGQSYFVCSNGKQIYWADPKL